MFAAGMKRHDLRPMQQEYKSMPNAEPATQSHVAAMRDVPPGLVDHWADPFRNLSDDELANMMRHEILHDRRVLGSIERLKAMAWLAAARIEELSREATELHARIDAFREAVKWFDDPKP
jgi:hypothetical protein